MPVDEAKARGLLGQLAEQGDAGAQFKLALMYYHGHGGPKDVEKAEMLLQQSADQGHTEAKHQLEVIEKAHARAKAETKAKVAKKSGGANTKEPKKEEMEEQQTKTPNQN